MGRLTRSRRRSLAAAVLLAAVPIPAILNAQIVAPLVTDRPDFTESALTVPRGDPQLESGYTLTRADDADEHALGEVLLRIGVAGRLE
ncbi:MAG: hypothetical protein ACREK5_05485, partial [Gemmatimonadota bacterium]